MPDKLERQVQFIDTNDYSFVYSDYEKINYLGERNHRLVKMPKSSTFWDLLETCTIPCLTVMMKKEIIGDTRFKFIPKEDFAFWLEILKKGVTAYNVGEVLTLYREQQHSHSSNKFDMIKNQWYILREVEGISFIPSIYFMATFIFKGLLKYIK